MICVTVCKCYVYTAVCVFGYYSEFKLVQVDMMSSQDHTLCMFHLHNHFHSTVQTTPLYSCMTVTNNKIICEHTFGSVIIYATFIPLTLFASVKSLHQRLALFIWGKKKNKKEEEEKNETRKTNKPELKNKMTNPTRVHVNKSVKGSLHGRHF